MLTGKRMESRKSGKGKRRMRSKMGEGMIDGWKGGERWREV
jgi:hypothetical protein